MDENGLGDPPNFSARSVVGTPLPGPGRRGTVCRGSRDAWICRSWGRRSRLLRDCAEWRAGPPVPAPGSVGNAGGSPGSGGARRPLCTFQRGRVCGRPAPGLTRTRLPAPARQVFRVEVQYRGRRHTVPRRYSEFHALHKRVRRRRRPTDRPRPDSCQSWEAGDELRPPPLSPSLSPESLEGSGLGH